MKCYLKQYVVSKYTSSHGGFVVLKDDRRKVGIGGFAIAIDSSTKKEPDPINVAPRERTISEALRGQVLVIKYCCSHASNKI